MNTHLIRWRQRKWNVLKRLVIKQGKPLVRGYSIKDIYPTFCTLTLRTRPLVLPNKLLCFFKCLKLQRLFHEFINQYQACLYSFECIFILIPNIVMEINNFGNFEHICKLLDLSSAHAYRVGSVNDRHLYIVGCPCKCCFTNLCTTVQPLFISIYQLVESLSSINTIIPWVKGTTLVLWNWALSKLKIDVKR